MALTDKLSAIGNAIREKGGTTELLTLDEMPVAIGAIETGGGGGDIPEEMRTFTGDIGYLFSKGRFLDWQDKYPFILKDIERTNYTFNSTPKDYDLSKIIITTKNYNDVNDGAYIVSIFDNNQTNSLPVINGRIAILNSYLFNACRYLTDDTIRNFIMNPNLELAWSNANNRSGNPGLIQMFSSCYSLRNINDILLYIHQYFRDNPISYSSSLTDYYANAFYSSDNLDEIRNIPIFEFPNHGGNTYDVFSSAFGYCGRVKEITFATDNGIPYERKWKNQKIDLSTRVGYLTTITAFSPYNSGITADKEVKDDATYQALKDNPDWLTAKVEYSRYNHDSAVNTINSLPDTSAYLATAGGTNTIKFNGKAGSLTDGGAINTLTADEIAVAAAKGWTVTFA